MTDLASLWMPILVSTVIVFFASWMIHTLPLWHRNDFPALPKEDAVMNALRPFDIPPGDYMMPRCTSASDMKSAEFMEKMKRGPVIFMTVMPSGPMAMGKSLLLWFIYCVVVGLFSGYVASRAHGPGADYLKVFQLVGATAFMGYALATWQEHIWFKRGLGHTVKRTFDGLIYGCLTAGAFGWLWPKALSASSLLPVTPQ